MSQTAAHLMDHVIPHVPVCQSVLPMPIPLPVRMAAQPESITLVLQVVQRELTRQLLEAAGLEVHEGPGGAVTLMRQSTSAANLNIPLHCLLLDGVYRRDADARRASSRRMRPQTTNCIDCCRPTQPG